MASSKDKLSEQEEWLKKHTYECPLGRVTIELCKEIRKRPTLRQILGDMPILPSRNWYNAPVLPEVCEGCPGLEKLIKEGRDRDENIRVENEN